MIRVSSALVEAARAGDAAAIGQLLTVCQPDLRLFARRKCSNFEDAEDAMQVALWQIHRKVVALRAAGGFVRWLFRIVERECYRLFRQRVKTVSIDEVGYFEPTVPRVPVELQLDLSRLIASLPPAYRETLILRDVEEQPAAEVAARLGITVEAVKSRLHRGRALMREGLLQSGYWTTAPLE